MEEAVAPAVFHLQGASVASAQADTEPGDPMFENVIDQIFPESLRTAAAAAAAEQQIPNVDALVQQADVRGGC